MIDIISLTGLVGSGASIYGVISAIKAGSDFNEMLNSFDALENKIDSITDKISILHGDILRDRSLNEQVYFRKVNIQKELLTPIQEILELNILSSIPIKTPKSFQRGLKYNPREILLNIDKLEHSNFNKNGSMIPVLFCENMTYYVGWQLPSTISLMFDLEIKESYLSYENGHKSVNHENLPLDSYAVETYKKRVKGANPVVLYDLAVIFYLRARDLDDVLYARDLLTKSANSGYELSKIRLQALNKKLLLSTK